MVFQLPTVLAVCDSNRPEFAQVCNPLVNTCRLTLAPTIEAACDQLRCATECPDLIVIGQPRPGEFNQTAIEALRSLAPLARIVSIFGSWCEGETRTGKPWLGVSRVAWHEWPHRWRDELRRISAGQIPLWSLPTTTTEEERLLARANEGVSLRHGTMVVVAEVSAAASSLDHACRLHGYDTLVCRQETDVRASHAIAVLWDTTAEQATNREIVTKLRRRFAGAPIIAITTFLRPRQREQSLAAGVASHISKPFLLDDLFAEIARV